MNIFPGITQAFWLVDVPKGLGIWLIGEGVIFMLENIMIPEWVGLIWNHNYGFRPKLHDPMFNCHYVTSILKLHNLIV